MADDRTVEQRTEDTRRQQRIKSHANYSMALLETSFLWRASGRYLILHADNEVRNPSH